jgi:hypothetical protein
VEASNDERWPRLSPGSTPFRSSCALVAEIFEIVSRLNREEKVAVEFYLGLTGVGQRKRWLS